MGGVLLTGDLTKFKKNPFVIKEGCTYQIKIQFRVSSVDTVHMFVTVPFQVQREIVAGLRYVQLTYRKGIKGEL